MDLEGSAHSAACVTDPPKIVDLSLGSPLTGTPPTVRDSRLEPFIRFWRDNPGAIVRVFVVFLIPSRVIQCRNLL